MRTGVFLLAIWTIRVVLGRLLAGLFCFAIMVRRSDSTGQVVVASVVILVS